MNIITRELETDVLDWAVATALGRPIKHDPMGFFTGSEAGYWIWDDGGPLHRSEYQKIGREFSPRQRWEQAGPLLAQYRISISQPENGPCEAYIEAQGSKTHRHVSAAGQPLVAAMRCLVSRLIGEKVEVPSRLMYLDAKAQSEKRRAPVASAVPQC